MRCAMCDTAPGAVGGAGGPGMSTLSRKVTPADATFFWGVYPESRDVARPRCFAPRARPAPRPGLMSARAPSPRPFRRRPPPSARSGDV